MRAYARAVLLTVVTAPSLVAQDSLTPSRQHLCDASLAQAAEARQHRARVISGAVAVAGLALPLAIIASRPGHSNIGWVAPALIGVTAARLVTVNMTYNTANQPAAWDDVLEKFRPGETRMTDVRTCLGRPTSITTQLVGADTTGASPGNGSEEIWVYVIRKGNVLIPFSSSNRTVTITFRGALLTSIRKTESRP